MSAKVPDERVGMKDTNGGSKAHGGEGADDHADRLAVRAPAGHDRDAGRIVTHDLAMACRIRVAAPTPRECVLALGNPDS